MSKASMRVAAGAVAAAGVVLLGTSPTAAAAPSGPVKVTASATPDGASIEIVYEANLAGFYGPVCTSTVRGAGVLGETIVTTTSIRIFGGTPVIVSPKTANRYRITYTCTAGEVGGPSSSNGSSLYVQIAGGLPPAPIIFGS